MEAVHAADSRDGPGDAMQNGTLRDFHARGIHDAAHRVSDIGDVAAAYRVEKRGRRRRIVGDYEGQRRPKGASRRRGDRRKQRMSDGLGHRRDAGVRKARHRIGEPMENGAARRTMKVL